MTVVPQADILYARGFLPRPAVEGDDEAVDEGKEEHEQDGDIEMAIVVAPTPAGENDTSPAAGLSEKKEKESGAKSSKNENVASAKIIEASQSTRDDTNNTEKKKDAGDMSAKEADTASFKKSFKKAES